LRRDAACAGWASEWRGECSGAIDVFDVFGNSDYRRLERGEWGERSGIIVRIFDGIVDDYIDLGDGRFEHFIDATGAESELVAESLLRQRDDGHRFAGDAATDAR
jgi:hypothetical protein